MKLAIPLDLRVGRGGSLKLAISLFHDIHGHVDNKIILEIGTSRGKLGGGPEGDGWASVLFGWYCKTYNGKLYTIDIDKHCIAECKKLTEEYKNNIEYVNLEAETFLKTFTDKISFLYLDGSDDPEEMYNQFELAKPFLVDKAIILLDDIPYNYKSFGKGRILVPYLINHQYKLLYHDYNNKVNQICFLNEQNPVS